MNNEVSTWEIRITGLVQGVGFRPFIYVLAESFQLTGFVENRNDGVLIQLNCNEDKLNSFIQDINKKAPIASSIQEIISNKIAYKEFETFSIKKSESSSDAVTEVSPDIAICDDCLEDMKNQDHRLHYPFTNCTNCGPRFTIIRDLPYDRVKTTMDEFKMCSICESEYTDIYDRRFHAQPVACNNCGPEYTLHYKNTATSDINEILSISSELINKGKLIAIKGLGGYHLMCDANNSTAVNNLRLLKKRESKAFAVMMKNIETVKEYAFINSSEEEILKSWQRPILLLRTKNKTAPEVSAGLSNIGVMLPYMPFHHQLFDHLKTNAIVLTSGNFSDEPIIISNDQALNSFTGKTDAIITYNRKIHNRTDDSVAIVMNKKARLIRRSRGYAPASIPLKLRTEGIFASGAEFVNCFCIGKDKRAFMSQHIGDLKNLETFDFYKESYNLYKRLFRFQPKVIVSDLHPDYLSAKFADSIHEEKPELPHIKVQHHHAHIASCMAEYNLDEKVIGISFDGVGLGTDGHIWGSEFLINDLEGFERVQHFEYIKVAGGDAVSKEAWRSACSYLFHYFGDESIEIAKQLVPQVGEQKLNMYLNILKNDFNSYLTCSAGRLFDAVLALIGLVHNAAYHAEAPMKLESIIADSVNESYEFEMNDSISFKKTFKGIINDLHNNVDISKISAKFHNTVAESIIKNAELISSSSKLNKVVLSGGTFQNKYLTEKVENILTNKGFQVYSQSSFPSNDGGIALGQLVIAAKKTHS